MSETSGTLVVGILVGFCIGLAVAAWHSDGRIDESQRASAELGSRLEIIQRELDQSRTDGRRIRSEIGDAVRGVDRSISRITEIDELIEIIEAFIWRIAALGLGEL